MINKCFNYLASGFFRTLGRLLLYVAIGFIGYLCFDKGIIKIPKFKPLTITAERKIYLASNQGISQNQYQVRGTGCTGPLQCYDTTINNGGYKNAWTYFYPNSEFLNSSVYPNANITRIIRSYFRVKSNGDMTSNRTYTITFKQVIETAQYSAISDPSMWVYDIGAYNGSSWGDKTNINSCISTKLEDDYQYLTTCIFMPKETLKEIVVNTYFNGAITNNANESVKGLNDILSYTVSNGTLTYETTGSDTSGAINAQTQTITNQTNTIIDKQEELINQITSTETPSTDSMSNNTTTTILPAGPLDSIINLPLDLLNAIIIALGGSCIAFTINLPFVSKNLTIPCISSIYTSMGFDSFFNWVGLVASAFILFKYIISLYNYVDKTLTFRENHFMDNWSNLD